jgi:hypothetical protein
MNKKERQQQLHHHFYLHKGVQNLKLECDDPDGCYSEYRGI